jgi:hypothetical protein
MTESENPKPDEEAGTAKEEGQELAATPDGISPDQFARMILNPAFNGGLALKGVMPPVGPVLDVLALADELEAQSKAATEGNLARHEALLTAQAHTLDGLFTQLVVQAEVGSGQSLPRMETYVRLALKAQSQCRATIEALAAMKRPPLVIAQQANVAHGPQQVNNGLVVGENPAAQNKLLEQGGGERLDPGAAQAAFPGDTAVAPVGAVDRAEDG